MKFCKVCHEEKISENAWTCADCKVDASINRKVKKMREDNTDWYYYNVDKKAPSIDDEENLTSEDYLS